MVIAETVAQICGWPSILEPRFQFDFLTGPAYGQEVPQTRRTDSCARRRNIDKVRGARIARFRSKLLKSAGPNNPKDLFFRLSWEGNDSFKGRTSLNLAGEDRRFAKSTLDSGEAKHVWNVNMWTIDQIEINGGFLPGLRLTFPHGLICIIGPRGSGKSTLAEALRFAIKGAVWASRQRMDLLQANIGTSGLVTLVANAGPETKYTIRRAYKQAAIMLASDGRMVPNVDLDRGTFLPLDAYKQPGNRRYS